MNERTNDARETGIAHELLGFHGTASRNIESITREGFRPGQLGVHGGAIYLASTAPESHAYAYPHTSGKAKWRMLGCRALVYDDERWRHKGHISAIDPARVLPVCILEYTPRFPRSRNH